MKHQLKRAAARWISRLATAFAVTMVSALAACGGGSDTPTSTDPTGTQPPPVTPPVTPPDTPPAPTSAPFLVLPTRLTLNVGSGGGLVALRAPAGVSWSSSDASVARVDAQGQVQALAAGTAIISATAGTQTRSASVKVHAGGAAPSSALIAAALAEQRISAEQALTYRVFARYGDARLPAQLDGAPSATPDHSLMREVAGRFGSLSAAAQQTLQPFLLPPIYAESWVAQQMGLSASAAPAALAAPQRGKGPSADTAANKSTSTSARRQATAVNCRVAAFPTGWLKRTTAHFNIHYPDVAGGDLTEANMAQAVAAVVEDVYQAITAQFGRFPRSDANAACNGGDGAIDIYLDYFLPPADHAQTQSYTACQNNAAFIALNSSLPFFRQGVGQRPTDPAVQRGVKAVLAHEITHLLQFGMARAGSCADNAWLDEAVAEWAVDHIDPTLNLFEDGFIKLPTGGVRTGTFLLRYLAHDHHRSIEANGPDEQPGQHGYAEYLFIQYLARQYTPQTVKRIVDAQAGLASVEALESALTPHGGMKAVWPDFARTLWIGRAQQVLDYWVGADGYDYGLANIFEPAAGDAFAAGLPQLKSLKVEQQGQPRASFKLLRNALAFPGTSYEIDPRSFRYEHLKFDDANVHSVLLVNPIAILPNREFIKLQAVKKIGGRWQAPEDWTADSTKSFCLDQRSERVEELLLIVSNSEVNRGSEQPFRIPQIFPLRVSTSNVGCWRWSGTASTETTYDDGLISGSITSSGVVRFEVTNLGPGRYYFEPRAGFVDGSGRGLLGGCSFTELAECKTLVTSGAPDGLMIVNLDLQFSDLEAPTRTLDALTGAAAMTSTRTLSCPGLTTTSSGPVSFDWLKVDDATRYAVSANGRVIEGEYIASFPATRSSIATRFRLTAERE